MPSKKQRAKKPGSKVAQEKVAVESRRGAVWAHQEDDAAQWIQQQLQRQQEVELRGSIRTCPPQDHEQQRPGEEADSHDTGRKKRDAIECRAEGIQDEVHNAAGNGDDKVRMTMNDSPPDVMNTHTPPERGGQNAVKSTVSSKGATHSTDVEGSRNPGMIAMKGLLREHGLATVPAEWYSTMGKLLLQEVLQVRVNKLKKAKQQREKRRENRKEKGSGHAVHPS